MVIHEGTLKTLRRFKDEVRDVQQGYECGMAFENYDNIKEGDMIEAFEMESNRTAIGLEGMTTRDEKTRSHASPDTLPVNASYASLNKSATCSLKSCSAAASTGRPSAA